MFSMRYRYSTTSLLTTSCGFSMFIRIRSPAIASSATPASDSFFLTASTTLSIYSLIWWSVRSGSETNAASFSNMPIKSIERNTCGFTQSVKFAAPFERTLSASSRRQACNFHKPRGPWSYLWGRNCTVQDILWHREERTCRCQHHHLRRWCQQMKQKCS